MSYHSFKLLDGYSMSTTDGYNFVSPWVDVHSSPYFSATAVFSGASIANGTLKLQQSNDRQSQHPDINGLMFPYSAANSTSSPTDVVDVPASLTGTVTQTISATGTYVFNQFLFGGRWVRFTFTKTGAPNTSTVVDIFFHFKG